MYFYCRHFETDNYIVLKFCHYINSDTMHLHAEYDDYTIYSILSNEFSLSKHKHTDRRKIYTF